MDGWMEVWMDRGKKGQINGQTDGWINRWTNGQTAFLPILQDFVPFWGCCPATLRDFETSKWQDKGTADHIMPVGDRLNLSLI